MSEYEEGSHAEESHGSHGHASHGHGHASHGKSGGGAVGILKAIHGATKKDAKPETHPTQTPLAPGQVPGQVPSQAPPPNSQQPILNGQPSLQPGYDPNHPQPVNGAPAHANDVPVTAEAKKEEKQDFMDKGLNAGFKKFGGEKYKDPEKNKDLNAKIKKVVKAVFKHFSKHP